MSKHAAVLKIFAPAGIITGLLWVSSLNPVSPVHVMLAYALLCVPWVSYMRWKDDKESLVPIYAFISFMFFIYYAVPLFWDQRVWTDQGAGFQGSDTVTVSMCMALLGVVCFGIGMRTRFGKKFAIHKVRDISPDPKHWAYLRLLLVGGSLFNVIPNAQYIGGESFRQEIIGLQQTIPLIVFVFIFRQFLRGRSTKLDKYVLLTFLCAQLIVGLSSGWLGSWIYVAGAALATYLLERRKMPVIPILILVGYALFFQAGKNQFRSVYWSGPTAGSGSPLARVQSWAQFSVDKWTTILQDPQQNSSAALLSDTVQRLSLLPITARVAELTPSPVPYQYGATYEGIVLNLIPRAVWPDKPIVNVSNQYFQVAYGFTAAQNLSQVSIASGLVAEGYINFGWFGVALAMFLLGVLFSFFEATFFSQRSGFLYMAVGIILLARFLTIEEQATQYLGGVVQTIVLAFIVFFTVSHWVEPDEKDASAPSIVLENSRAKKHSRSRSKQGTSLPST